MNKLSGLVLDVFDDVDGAVLRKLFPQHGQVPDLVKAAGVLGEEARAHLPDDLFALVIQDGDVTLRKYACTDVGNVALNVLYLTQRAHLLPEEAVKVAADNLCIACNWYDVEPPDELKKLSTGNIPVIGKQQIWKSMDGDVYHNDTQSWDLSKVAEVVGTSDMPLQAPKKQTDPTRKSLAVIPKTAEADELAEAFGIRIAERGVDMGVGDGLPEKDNPEANPQAKVMKPHVDVSGKEPPRLLEDKAASLYCMPSIGCYPIDNFLQVKTANLYFKEQHKNMLPEDRREYASNLYKRASQLSFPVAQIVEEYGMPGFAKKGHVSNCIGIRLVLLQPHAEQGDTNELKQAGVHTIGLYNELLDKYGLMDPDLFAATLSEIDKAAGINELWDGDVPDPYYSTLAKTAAEAVADPKDSIVIGNDYMTVQDLQTFASARGEQLKDRFGCEFVKEFKADPTGIFDSLPADQKKVIMRMVNTSRTATFGATAA